MMGRLSSRFVFGVVLVAAATASADLLRNGGFEAIPGPVSGQGILPSDFAAAGGPFLVGADTYSNDGSFGLFPFEFGNFPGITAAEGIRFVAAGDFGGVRESFGQELTQTLAPLGVYRLSAALHESPRFATRGSFSLLLSPTLAAADPAAVVVGQFSATEGTGGWEDRSFEFRAPGQADDLPFVILVPNAVGSDVTYVAMDRLSLVPVPEVSSWFLVAAGVFIVGVGRLHGRTRKVPA
jgi:hypothetical protein